MAYNKIGQVNAEWTKLEFSNKEQFNKQLQHLLTQAMNAFLPKIDSTKKGYTIGFQIFGLPGTGELFKERRDPLVEGSAYLVKFFAGQLCQKLKEAGKKVEMKRENGRYPNGTVYVLSSSVYNRTFGESNLDIYIEKL